MGGFRAYKKMEEIGHDLQYEHIQYEAVVIGKNCIKIPPFCSDMFG
jgi:hypothetical protein